MKEKAKKGMFGEKKRMKDARDKIETIDDKLDIVLKRAYPLLTQGLGWTFPHQTVRMSADSLEFDVFPFYIPEGKEDAVAIIVASRPELTVT